MISNSTTSILFFIVLTMLGLIGWVAYANIQNLDFEFLRSLSVLQGEAENQNPPSGLPAQPVPPRREAPIRPPAGGAPFSQ